MEVSRESIILDDEEIRFFTDYTPYAEGSPIGDFWGELAVVANELKDKQETALPKDKQSILVMRACYLLGVLRGGECYRSGIVSIVENGDEPESMSFALSDSCESSAEFDLCNISKQEVRSVLGKLGM